MSCNGGRMCLKARSCRFSCITHVEGSGGEGSWKITLRSYNCWLFSGMTHSLTIRFQSTTL